MFHFLVTFKIEVTNLVHPSTNTIYENVKAVDGENLYQAMCTLEKIPGSGFTFKSDVSTYGHFITSINGLDEDKTKDDYWTIRINKLEIWAPKGEYTLFMNWNFLFWCKFVAMSSWWD
ncbi:hypothetical protein BSL78_12641 [Apostichopus japonicus]|uniref:Transcobalamin-like C-terminal domain-containing protein n=1 Tax=Stichopus japonicus TaxID=307972 RepID=A0A2G8KR73_STIJA|nr:hypothetical protein BSL78_12641 [Apostichopus japonicus]